MSVELIDISHRYGTDPLVLKNVAITFSPGALVGVVGPSGSGKSTLLAIAGLLTRPWHGNVTYDGQPVRWRNAFSKVDRSQIAWVFQSSNLLPRRTALENTMMGALSRGDSVDNAKRVALDALTQLKLGQLAQVAVRYLSGGEAQRVGIARALANRPTYLFADEPTGQLDTATTRIVLDALSHRRDESLITVIATHDPVVASACDQVYQVADGRIAQEV